MRITNLKVARHNASWEPLVAPRGYVVLDSAFPTGSVLGCENRPHGVNKQYLKFVDVDTLFFPQFVPRSEIAENDPLVHCDAEQWISALDWKHPDDDIPFEPKKLQTASLSVDPSFLPGMFLDFAHLNPVESDIFDFCSRYGFLGLNTYLVVDLTGKKSWSENYGEWCIEAYKFKLLHNLWQAVVRLDQEYIDYYVELDADKVRLKYDYISYLEPSSGLLTEEFDFRHVEPSDDVIGPVVRSGHTVVHGLLRRSIRRTCTVDFDLKPSSLIELRPHCLLGAMYCQLLSSIKGESQQVRKCLFCGRHFAIHDPRKRYCSDNCRVNANRAKLRKERENG